MIRGMELEFLLREAERLSLALQLEKADQPLPFDARIRSFTAAGLVIQLARPDELLVPSAHYTLRYSLGGQNISGSLSVLRRDGDGWLCSVPDTLSVLKTAATPQPSLIVELGSPRGFVTSADAVFQHGMRVLIRHKAEAPWDEFQARMSVSARLITPRRRIRCDALILGIHKSNEKLSLELSLNALQPEDYRFLRATIDNAEA